MGKVQSKLVSKRRQSPEGGSLVSNVLTCQSDLERIHKTKLTEVTKCHMVPDEDTQREWVFTLYNFDNSDMVNPEDMTSLMHSMYEVLEASVKPPCGGRTPLKIKLVVTPSADPESILQIATEKEQSALSQDSGNQGRSCYCVDENIERRNHYLDLAGIENYTSKFDNTEPLSHEPSKDNHSAPKHHPVVIRERYVSPGSPRGLSVPPSLKSKAVSVGKDRNGGQGKSCRLHGQLPASSGRPSQPAAHSVLQRSHSKRVRSRVPEAPRSTPGGDKEMFSILQSPRAQRHEHHHHHDHHHHHHYYHHHHHHPWGNEF